MTKLSLQYIFAPLWLFSPLLSVLHNLPGIVIVYCVCIGLCVLCLKLHAQNTELFCLIRGSCS